MARRWLILTATLAMAAPARADRLLSLAEAIALARARRSEIGQAQVDLRRSQLNVLRARLERVHLSLQASGAEQAQTWNGSGQSAAVNCGQSPASCQIESHPFSVAANLTVPLWSGFTVEAHLAGAHAAERAAEAARRAALNSIGLDAATAYWEVRRAELALDVARHALERTQAIEHVAKTRVTAGISPQVDFERAHVSTMRQAEQVNAIESAELVARAQLGLALQVDEPLALGEDPAAHAPPLPELATQLERAAHQRPELAQTRALVDAQAQAVRAAKGAYWPQLSLFGQATASNQDFYYYASNTATTLTREQDLVFTAIGGLRLDWLFFDTLSTWTAVRDAGLVRDRAALDAERARYQVRADVLAAHGRLRIALERKVIVADAVATARRALDLLGKRYQVGEALLVELLLAQTDLTQLEGDLMDAAVSTAEAEAELLAATGQL